jgi:hypothetical protein
MARGIARWGPQNPKQRTTSRSWLLLEAGPTRLAFLDGDVTVFEVQEKTDVTLSLYDWGYVDPSTGESRTLQA